MEDGDTHDNETDVVDILDDILNEQRALESQLDQTLKQSVDKKLGDQVEVLPQ